ncbi:MliC family protein [Wenxinia saemankumensis]|uniref:Membrane-bound inhibitor of C-type lysozyme n=1 Tax=Wenxinia saemankumensis TaxID=1447782 RepID=A0A1M6D2N0_9RHOB|nr:MliC family protein [Wenxinia saemankumensis]SHI67373.1 Membrane-bound inhibitor of C-type lysozyme [Wenxinia saemankumensis]
MRGAALLAALLAPGVAAAELRTMRYVCERGVEVPVVYVPDAEPAAAVIGVEGGMYALEAEQAASGVRYGWPSDGSHYVWWTRGTEEAMLLWSDGETGEEVTLLAECRAG